jgi:lysyl-tRNA synthetase class 2
MPGYAVDEHLLAALAHGLPDCAGVAVGVDRLLMAVCEAETLSEVLTFGSG